MRVVDTIDMQSSVFTYRLGWSSAEAWDGRWLS